MNENSQAWRDYLDQQVDVISRVLASLDEESAALLNRDADALETALAAKNQWLSRAAELEETRRSMPDVGGDAEASVAWGNLTNLTRECRARNLHNGALIRGQRQRVEETLQWLRGDSDVPQLYGPDGERHGGVKSRATLSSA